MSFMTPVISTTPGQFLVADPARQDPICWPVNDLDGCPFRAYALSDGMYETDDFDLSEATTEEVIKRENRLGMEADEFFQILCWMQRIDIDEFELKTTHYGYLSAPGYLDRTDYVIGETQADCAEQLIDLYYDGETEYMSEDEKEELSWLTAISEGNDQAE